MLSYYIWGNNFVVVFVPIKERLPTRFCIFRKFKCDSLTVSPQIPPCTDEKTQNIFSSRSLKARRSRQKPDFHRGRAPTSFKSTSLLMFVARVAKTSPPLFRNNNTRSTDCAFCPTPAAGGGRQGGSASCESRWIGRPRQRPEVCPWTAVAGSVFAVRLLVLRARGHCSVDPAAAAAAAAAERGSHRVLPVPNLNYFLAVSPIFDRRAAELDSTRL